MIYKFLAVFILLPSLACADILTEYAFDPGLTVRRIANIRQVADPLYWESCLDDTNGCRAMREGEGFHTLGGGSLADVATNCRVNSGGNCPFFAVWDAGGLSLGLVTTGMINPLTYNTYIALQDNLPQYGGAYRMGSFDHPPITHAATSFLLADQFIYAPPGSHARVMSGIAWWTPSGTYVLEMNIDVANPWTYWPLTERLFRSPNCAPVTCLYLGGRAWGIPSRTGTSRERIVIDWAVVAQKLVASGDLPTSALADMFVADGWYTGQEIVGPAVVGVQIADRHIYGIEHSPVGRVDTRNNGYVYDIDNMSVAVSVEIFADGPLGKGTKVATLLANDPSPDLVALGYVGAHRWHWSAPIGHVYYFYGVDVETGERKVLSMSGKR